MERFDAIVVGARTAEVLCAVQMGQLGYRILLLGSGRKPGRKILMSDGNHCNFANMYVEPAAYLSQNSYFRKPALAHCTQWGFIRLIGKYGVAWHEKTFDQLFCDDSAEQIVNLLLTEYEKSDVQICLRSEILSIERDEQGCRLQVSDETLMTEKPVIAPGGLSIPGLGASSFGYKVAEQFGLKVLPTHAGLIPFALRKPLLEQLQVLSGVSVPSTITAENGTLFRKNLLFIRHGLSGPAMLQISSYWQPGEFVTVNLLPGCNLENFLNEQRSAYPSQNPKSTLAMQLPKRLVKCLRQPGQIPNITLKQLNVRGRQTLVETLTAWRVQPSGTGGYRTAEVTLGDVDTNELSSRTMKARKASGLYFIGEVMDITGWPGDYSFQWAWSSAWACAQTLVEE